MKTRYPIAPEVHLRIRQTYMNSSRSGEVAVLAKHMYLPCWQKVDKHWWVDTVSEGVIK